MADDDSKYEIPLFERPNPGRDMLMCLCIVVKGQLDVDLLKPSFTILVARWPKLGAYFECANIKEWNVSICIPSNFDSTSFSFTTKDCKDEAIIPDLPQKGADIDMGPICYSHSHLFKDESTPKTCLEILQQNKAHTTYLHVTTFQDATCIGLTLPHITYDDIALCEVVHEWCHILSADEIKRESIIGDPYQVITTMPYPKTKSELQAMHKKKLSTVQLFTWKEWIIWLGKFIVNAIIYRKEKSKLVFIPQRHIDSIRDSAAKKGNWIRENDVVTALLFKLGLIRYKASYDGYMTLAFIGNMRGLLPTLPKDDSRVFLGNAGFAMGVPAQKMTNTRKLSAEEVAVNLRKAIESQRDIEQLRIAASIWCELARRGTFIQDHKSGGDYYCITSWARGKMYNYDFSPALIKETNRPNIDGNKDKDALQAQEGRVLHADGTAGITNAPKRGWCILFGKDSNGKEPGRWAEFTAPLYAWPEIDKETESWWS